jgi:hypothetical protein
MGHEILDSNSSGATAEDLAMTYQSATGEGWDFDGMSYDEFLALPQDMQERAMAGYRERMGAVLKSEVRDNPVQEAADPYFRGDWHGHDTATQGSIDL